MSDQHRKSLVPVLAALFAASVVQPVAAARGVRASAAASVTAGGGYGGTSAYRPPTSSRGTPAQQAANAYRNAAVSGSVDVQRRPEVDPRIRGDVNVGGDLVVDPDYGCCYDEHPVAKAAIAGAAVAIGSLAYELPPGCVTVETEGYVYEQCGDTWYAPEMTGYETYYIVVNPPE